MKTFTFISPETILARVLPAVDDESQTFRSPGYYMAEVQNAIQALAFSTFFDEKWKDFKFPVDDFNLEMPEGAIDIVNIYLFNGDKCDIGYAQKVYWKQDFYKKGQGYLAKNRGYNGNDPFFPNNSLILRDPDGVRTITGHKNTVGVRYYYNIQEGRIMFSTECNKFEKVMIQYKGIGCNLGDAPIIPVQFREAIEHYIIEAVLRIRMAKEPTKGWATLWSIYDKKLNQPYEGSWERARKYVTDMTTDEKWSLSEYLGKGQWQ